MINVNCMNLHGAGFKKWNDTSKCFKNRANFQCKSNCFFFSVQKYERSVPINGSNDRYTDKWLILLLARLDLGVAEDLGT